MSLQRITPIEAGNLDRRILIQAPPETGVTQDAVGQPITTGWQTIYSCWASIDAQNSQLMYDTEQFVAQATIRIEIRYTSSIVFNVGMQIVYVEATTGVTHTYEIKGILNPRQGNYRMAFLCYELQEQE